MFLASGDVLWPVAGVCLLVVEEAADAELLGRGPVPAGPVAGAGGLVAEDAVQPVAVLRALGRVWDRTGLDNQKIFVLCSRRCGRIVIIIRSVESDTRYPPTLPFTLHCCLLSV